MKILLVKTKLDLDDSHIFSVSKDNPTLSLSNSSRMPFRVHQKSDTKGIGGTFSKDTKCCKTMPPFYYSM